MVWTPTGGPGEAHKIVSTKKAGRDEMRAWRLRYEELGWKVSGLGRDAIKAEHPAVGGLAHAIVFHEYDAETKERIWEPPRKLSKPTPVPAAPKPRRGRVPVGA